MVFNQKFKKNNANIAGRIRQRRAFCVDNMDSSDLYLVGSWRRIRSRISSGMPEKSICPSLRGRKMEGKGGKGKGRSEKGEGKREFVPGKGESVEKEKVWESVEGE